MKRLLLFLAVAFWLLPAFGQSILTAGGLAAFIGTNAASGGGGGGGGSWTLVAHASATTATSSGTATTSAIDTTGSKFLAISIMWAGGGPVTVSDSLGNAWVSNVNYAANSPKVQWYYVTNATGKVGAGHTFSGSYNAGKAIINVYAFSVSSGQPTLDGDVGARNTSWNGNAVSTGSLTPSTSTNLFLSAAAWDVNTATIVTNNALFIYPEPLIFSANGLRSGYKIHASDSSAENPAWLQSPTANADVDVNQVTFKLQ